MKENNGPGQPDHWTGSCIMVFKKHHHALGAILAGFEQGMSWNDPYKPSSVASYKGIPRFIHSPEQQQAKTGLKKQSKVLEQRKWQIPECPLKKC